MTARRSIHVAAVLLLIGTESACGADAFAARLFGQMPGPGKTFSCFARSYDAAHLASHPGQQVTFMEILVTHYGGKLDFNQLRIGFRFRNRPELLTTVSECGSVASVVADGTAVCAGPGNGETRVRWAGRNALEVALPIGIHLWKPGPPDPQHTVDDAFGADDRLFRLDRLPPTRCIDQAFEDEKRLPRRQP